MTQHASLALNDHEAEFVERQVVNGTYASAAEVLRAGLHMLEEHDAKVKALQAALQEGLDSGPPMPFDRDEFLQRMRDKYVSRS
ncbi:type II toxin-antitoxin system ParD family antitoxin [Devosia rhizoryzae]|uniref:Type II toxin-antitoxin system ParD family antitoxin n=1 Tax=Devosia rhizoryzae TaxID=2774137 RepID=A0ABX7C4V3_9HYPH|nr:type II toxin-antitoxin system ParD family antitoxin [Devosia rhizoryzae]QQR39233.1 type II toxin-antitoxin system ParD family antitoxin [Devosia rhizoryzae]